MLRLPLQRVPQVQERSATMPKDDAGRKKLANGTLQVVFAPDGPRGDWNRFTTIYARECPLAGCPAAALGYAAATAWACRGIASESAKTSPIVKTTAARCALVAVAAGAFALALGALKR